MNEIYNYGEENCFEIAAYKKGWLKKKMVYEVFTNEQNYFCYTLAALVLTLSKLKISENEIGLIVTKFEKKYYKVK